MLCFYCKDKDNIREYYNIDLFLTANLLLNCNNTAMVWVIKMKYNRCNPLIKLIVIQISLLNNLFYTCKSIKKMENRKDFLLLFCCFTIKLLSLQ